MEEKEVFGRLGGLKAKRIAVQLPDGLKAKAVEIADRYASEGFEPVIFTDPCYGACDLLDHEAKLLGCDAVVQLGHSEFRLRTELPYLFQEARCAEELGGITEKALPRLKGYDAIGIVTTVQHIGKVGDVKKALEAAGKKVLIGRHGARTAYDGQVQGCDFESAASVQDRVDAFVYVGSGNFHPLGVALYTGKPVVIIDPLLKEIRDITAQKDAILRQRFAAIEIAKKAESFGILLSTKRGQFRPAEAEKAKALIEKSGKKAYFLAGRELTPENIEGLRVDALVNTACPRLALDDYKRFKVPMISVPELEILFGLRKWENYKIDNFNRED